MSNKVIHIAMATLPGRGKCRLLLRKLGDHDYRWFVEGPEGEEESDISGLTVEEAMQAAQRHYRHDSFRTIICGFRYTLPERDEHGMNALFHQMVASLSTMNGVYYDEELGHNCYVQNSSDEAIAIWKELQSEGRL